MTARPPGRAAIVVPCFNEAARLDAAGLKELADLARAEVVFVDDGSTDATAFLLAELAAARPESFQVLRRPVNAGKGESVRLGLRTALDAGAQLVGYCDADLATPPAEMARLVEIARDRPDVHAVVGARVGLLGHRIERSMARHYLGRMFATASSVVLRLPIYDTQCGAKVFREGPELHAALDLPFTSRWAFDVELLDRLHRGAGDEAGIPAEGFLEVPLREWRDVGGSKLAPRDALQAVVDLANIARRR